MLKNKKIIFFVIVILIAGSLFWYFVLNITKEKAVKIIYKANTSRDQATLLGMDENYLIEWAKAIKSATPEFTHNGKTYDTGTGKAK
jgi:hypothetical protein